MIYVEREITGGGKRRGLVCRVDLEEYDYHPGSQALIRATEKQCWSGFRPGYIFGSMLLWSCPM